MTIFEKHPRPWFADRDRVRDAELGIVVAASHCDEEDVIAVIVSAVNAEPELRARVRELEAQLENLLDSHQEGAWMAQALDAERELNAIRARVAALEAEIASLRELWRADESRGMAREAALEACLRELRDARVVGWETVPTVEVHRRLPEVERADALLASAPSSIPGPLAESPETPAFHIRLSLEFRAHEMPNQLDVLRCIAWAIPDVGGSNVTMTSWRVSDVEEEPK